MEDAGEEEAADENGASTQMCYRPSSPRVFPKDTPGCFHDHSVVEYVCLESPEYNVGLWLCVLI